MCIRDRIVLSPTGFKVAVLLYDQINNIKLRQYVPEVVENLVVNELFKGVLIHFFFVIEQPIHLVDNVLRKVDNSSNNIQELVEHA